MAYTEIKRYAVDRGESGTKVLQLMELLIDSSSDTASLPDCLPGSVAYTADLSYMAMFDGTTWQRIGGAAS